MRLNELAHELTLTFVERQEAIIRKQDMAVRQAEDQAQPVSERNALHQFLARAVPLRRDSAKSTR